jgi:hypothetical protein
VRNIIESDHFSKCVESLGGYRAIDRALETIIEALVRNPYGFPSIENDWVRFRYARTTMIEGYIPALVVAFTINDNNDVVLEWVELADDAEIQE